jgi:tRNA G18 (ribose-2'-O)-methylase SpoU
MHLGGVTPTPDHPKLAKTALGAEASVPWTHYPDAARAAADMVARGLCLWAVEGGHTSQSIFDPQVRIPVAGPPVVVVLGHEVSGIDPRIVRQCERVVHIPMQGIKGSLNVSVALGVVSYVLRFGSR